MTGPGERSDRGDDGPWATATRVRTTRRGLLALVGTTALAGCGLPGLGGERTVELDAAALADVASGPAPSVTRPVPVAVGDERVAASRTRAASLLDAVPLPLSPEELPNGAMRGQLEREANNARAALADAGEASEPLDRLDELRDAREHARIVAAAWAYASDDLTAATVRETGAAVRADAAAFREEWTYVGVNPVRALLAHELVESWSGAARRYATLDEDRYERRPTNAITVGERAGEIELGRAYLGDARHVGERFTASLADPESMRATFEEARSSLADTLQSRREPLPGENADSLATIAGTDVDRTSPAGEALDDLFYDLPRPPESTADLAGDVVESLHGLVAVAAFASFRERVRSGERFPVESAADVETYRSAAVSAVEDALAGEDPLVRRVLSDYGWTLRAADDDLRDREGTVPADALALPVADYLRVAALARAAPDAAATVREALGVE